MFLHMVGVNTFLVVISSCSERASSKSSYGSFLVLCSSLVSGLISEFGYLSDAKATAAKVSMTILHHNNWEGAIGDSVKMIVPMNTVKRQLMLTVNWNCKNFLTDKKMFLPQNTALRTDLKSLSVYTS